MPSPRSASLTALLSSLMILVAGYAWAQSESTVSAPATIVTIPTVVTTATATPVAAAAPMNWVTAAPAAKSDPFNLGVQTHFHQGWPSGTIALAGQIGARLLRDTVPWDGTERKAGVYDFSGTANATLLGHCATGGKLILTINPSNALYDGGLSVYSDAGRAAYARYLTAVLNRFGNCIAGMEMGNEINGPNGLKYPVGYARGTTYAGLLRTVYATVKPSFPQVPLLAGSAHSVGTGFLEELLKAGALANVDGFTIHPYRSSGDGLAMEIDHLNAMMARYGTPKPIWATEFSYGSDDERRNAGDLIKSVVELYAAGVNHATWYALIEQKWFPNLGLFRNGAPKPVALSFRMLVDRVLPLGRPVRVDTGTLPIVAYRIGANRWIAWGSPATLRFNAEVMVRDVTGASVQSTRLVTLGEQPVLIEGGTAFKVSAAPVLADTLFQWGKAPWSYARRDKKVEIALGWFDTDFTSHFGDRWSKPLRINNSSAAPAGDGASPMRAIVRYTAPVAQRVELSACFSKSAATGDGVDYRIERNGTALVTGILIDKAAIRSLPFDLAAGDRIDIVVGPNQTYGGDSFGYRARISRPGFWALSCG